MNNLATRVGGDSYKIEFETSYYDEYLKVEALCRKLLNKDSNTFYGCCGNCKWYTGGGYSGSGEVCVNNESDWCGDFRTPNKLCECWEYKNGT